jgi:hypothetical protein
VSVRRTGPEGLVPNPLVSRGKPTFASVDSGWIALSVGVGPRRVLLCWASAPSRGGPEPQIAPRSYTIETSADSTLGSDGSWRPELSVSGNTERARAHCLEFDGQSWVRLSVQTDGAGVPALRLGAVSVHDASDGCDDTWLLLGDAGPTPADAELPLWARHFASTVHERYAGYFPAVIDGRTAGDTPRRALDRLDELLGLHPDVRHFVLAHSLPALHAGAASAELSDWRDSSRELIARLRAANKVPVLSRELPMSAAHEVSFRGLIEETGVLAVPALGVSADEMAGESAWADAMDDLYVPV